MTSGAIAAMLSTILYGRRFFPYYVYNIIGGLDEEGKYYGHTDIFFALECYCRLNIVHSQSAALLYQWPNVKT